MRSVYVVYIAAITVPRRVPQTHRQRLPQSAYSPVTRPLYNLLDIRAPIATHRDRHVDRTNRWVDTS